jgi:hypothetical protein
MKSQTGQLIEGAAGFSVNGVFPCEGLPTMIAQPPAQSARASFKMRLMARAQRPHCILQPRQP